MNPISDARQEVQFRLVRGDYDWVIAKGEATLAQMRAIITAPAGKSYDRVLFRQFMETLRETLAEALVHRGRFADAEAMLVSTVPLLSSPSTPYSTGQRLWLALAQARQNRGETALKTLAPAKAALKRLREDMATADQREQQARLLFIEAIAQPDTEAGRKHRRAALAEVSRFLETLTEEASRLYYPRILQRWITEERARTQ